MPRFQGVERMAAFGRVPIPPILPCKFKKKTAEKSENKIVVSKCAARSKMRSSKERWLDAHRAYGEHRMRKASQKEQRS